MESIALKLLTIGAALAAWFATQRMIGARAIAGGAIYDHLHFVTASWNGWLHRHPGATRAILIASSLGIDALTLFVLVYSVLGPSFYPFWGLLAVFLLRQISQGLVALPPPEGMIWRHPGVPSLFVTYGVGNDLFFSGHTALAVYGATQLASLQMPALTALGIAVAALEVVAVIALRAHYTMDVIAGIFAAVMIGALVW